MPEVVKSIVIQKPLDKVYGAYTSPSAIRWWYDSVAQIALRPHGHFTYADAEGDVYECGEFLEVKAGERLRFTVEHHGFFIGSEVSVDFLALAPEKTEVRVRHINLSASDAEHVSDSLDWSLQNLRSLLEDGSVKKFKNWFATRKKLNSP